MRTIVRLSGLSVLLANVAVVLGILISEIYNLGGEVLPLSGQEGLHHLGQFAELLTIRELLWLAYPILLLPKGIALYMLFRDRAPALLWALILWCIGLTFGIAVDILTVAVVRDLGVIYLASEATTQSVIESFAPSIAHTILLMQFIGDNLGATFVYPFFAIVAYRAGFIGRPLVIVNVLSVICVCLGYRGLNLLFLGETDISNIFAIGFFGLIWWEVSIAIKLLKTRSLNSVMVST
ncbi:MAG: hypothetical protein AAGF95_26630 [Chloroflexota bacterium]